MKIVNLLISRKFWAAVIGLVLIIVKPFMPDFPVEDVDSIVNPLVELIAVAVIIGSYIFGTAIESAAENKPAAKK